MNEGMTQTLYVCNIILSIIVPWPVFVRKFYSCTFNLYSKDPETPLKPSSVCTYIFTVCTPKDKLAEMERGALT